MNSTLHTSSIIGSSGDIDIHNNPVLMTILLSYETNVCVSIVRLVLLVVVVVGVVHKGLSVSTRQT